MLFYAAYFQVRFPPCVSTDACNLIDRLLDKNPASRLGGGSSDGAEVMGHEFFQDIKWRDLESKKVSRFRAGSSYFHDALLSRPVGRAALQTAAHLGNRHEFFRPGVYRGARQSLSTAIARTAAAAAAGAPGRRRRLRRRLGQPRLSRGI